MTGTFIGKAPETKRIKNLRQVTTGTFRTNSLVPAGCVRYAVTCCLWPMEFGDFVRDSLGFFKFRGIPFPLYSAIIGKVPQFKTVSARDPAEVSSNHTRMVTKEKVQENSSRKRYL